MMMMMMMMVMVMMMMMMMNDARPNLTSEFRKIAGRELRGKREGVEEGVRDGRKRRESVGCTTKRSTPCVA